MEARRRSTVAPRCLMQHAMDPGDKHRISLCGHRLPQPYCAEQSHLQEKTRRKVLLGWTKQHPAPRRLARSGRKTCCFRSMHTRLLPKGRSPCTLLASGIQSFSGRMVEGTLLPMPSSISFRYQLHPTLAFPQEAWCLGLQDHCLKVHRGEKGGFAILFIHP